MTKSSSCLLCCLFLFSMTSTAYAYLDPGTGSIVLQAIIGGVAAGMFIIRGYLYGLAVKLGLARLKDREKKVPGE